MKVPITVPGTTIGAHRLWTTLWTDLGQPEENLSLPGGNQLASRVWPGPLHSAVTAAGRPATGPVDTRKAAQLRKCQMSPASTDPMTTTFLYFTQIPSTKQAQRREASAAGPLIGTTARTGGVFL